MGRRVKCRRICEMPRIDEFAPANVNSQEEIEMTVDEFETIRLIDHQGYSQEECARQMNVARTTVQSIYDSARKKLAETLVDGKKLKIGGGAYEVCPNAKECCRRSCSQKECGNLGPGCYCSQGTCKQKPSNSCLCSPLENK